MKVPAETLLRLLEAGLKSGEIDPARVRKLLPRQRGSARVDKAIRTRAAELSKRHGIRADGLRFSAQRSGKHLALFILTEGDNKVAGPQLSERFTGLSDIDAAAERVIAAYLKHLDGAS